MDNFVITICGVALIACGLEVLISNAKAMREVPQHLRIENIKTIDDSQVTKANIQPPLPTSVSTSQQGAILVKGLDRYLDQLKQIPGLDPSDTSVLFEDVHTKHRYWIRKVK